MHSISAYIHYTYGFLGNVHTSLTFITHTDPNYFNFNHITMFEVRTILIIVVLPDEATEQSFPKLTALSSFKILINFY
jgi:hypothetical protein